MSQRQTLLELWQRLDRDDRSALLAFAQFLAARAPVPPIEPRPPRETVVAAIRRLSRGVDQARRHRLLGEASRLLAEQVLNGRDAAGTIDDLEKLFAGREPSSTP